MVLNINLDPLDLSSCALHYDEDKRWLLASWQGFVTALEAQHGAEAYLRAAERLSCPCLLNDNSRLQGPWFDSLDWLRQAWVPAAAALGLRYVAHVLQADRHDDVLLHSGLCALPFELQIFRDLADAQQWLHQVRAAAG